MGQIWNGLWDRNFKRPYLAVSITDFWHGTAWRYIVYGLYNGLIIAGSSLLMPVFRKGVERFHINPNSCGWHVRQTMRLLSYMQERRINTVYWVPSILCLIANFKALPELHLKELKMVFEAV